MSDNHRLSKSDDIVNNEDVINELTKNLESSLISDSDNTEPTASGAPLLGDDHPDFQIPTRSKEKDTNTAKEFDDGFDEDEKPKTDDNDTDDDEQHLKDVEVDLTEEEKLERQSQAEIHKSDGNAKFKINEYTESIECYTKGLRLCPLVYTKDRAILYSNRAASKMKLKNDKNAIKDCSKAIENDPTYVKAYYRRAQCYEATDSLDECLADFKKILELEPQHAEARKAIIRLPPLIEERNERLKTEMMSKLKDLGNLVLKPFGLSTENFQLTQDPETKGYSINFQQKQ